MLGRPAMWSPRGRASLLAVDIVGFSRPHLNMRVQVYLRARLYELIAEALRMSAVDPDRCYLEDRGDGFVAAIPPEIPTDQLIYPFAEHLRAGLRLHNQVSNDLGVLRLRLALHSGEALTDAHGLVGGSLIHLVRLLDAPSFKDVARRSHAYLALIASDVVYEQVIRHAPGLIDPDDYRCMIIEHSGFADTGWVRMVGRAPSVDRIA